jgi:hypothetical protein
MTLSWPRLYASTSDYEQYVNDCANYYDIEDIM